MRIYSLAVPVPVYRLFDYKSDEIIEPGSRVIVPFGRTEKTAYVIREITENKAFGDIKDISSIIDKEPLVDKKVLRLAELLSEYYIAPPGEVMKAVLPPSVKLPVKKLKKEKSKPPIDTGFLLSSYQEKIVKYLEKKIVNNEAGEVLIHGATASGKTEVYMRLAATLIDSKKQILILVPEIAITAQIVRRFEERFGSRSIATWHSRMTPVRKGEVLRRLIGGEADILIGTRSAVFASFKNLGAIVIDEEHDSSFKEENSPYYDSRRVAQYRIKTEGILLIRSSATPKIESMYRALNKDLPLMEIKEKISGSESTLIEVVDMRNERRGFFFSRRLLSSMEETLKRKAQIILMINRRGYAPFVVCKDCGENVKCPGCAAGLVYHKEKGSMLCHTCGKKLPPPSVCPGCSGKIFRYSGVGTQRVISALNKIFPEEKVLRLDSDRVISEGASEIYEKFSRGKYSIMVGTSLVSKGWDFPKVELVGVLNAETGLMHPDFRAPEKLYDLLFQISGRAGRGDRRGKMVLQTMNPSHYAVRELLSGKYINYYNKEIEIREAAGFPPFSNIIKVMATGASRETSYRRLKKVAAELRAPGVSVMGPVESGGYTRRGKSYHLLIKDSSGKAKCKLLELANAGKLAGLRIDVDPEEMI